VRGSDAGPSMLDWFVGYCKFAKIVSKHFILGGKGQKRKEENKTKEKLCLLHLAQKKYICLAAHTTNYIDIGHHHANTSHCIYPYKYQQIQKKKHMKIGHKYVHSSCVSACKTGVHRHIGN